MSRVMEAPRIKARPIYTVRECTDGGGRPHYHVAAFGRGAETEANRLNGVRAHG